jgi:YVTN family beta-propeller protein
LRQSAQVTSSAGRFVAAALIALLVVACGGSQLASPIASGAIGSAATTTVPTSASAPVANGRLVEPEVVIHLGSTVQEMTLGPTGVWVVTDAGIDRIDPASSKVATSYPLSPTADGYGLAVDANALWVSDFDNSLVYRLDPVTGKRIATIATPAGPGFLGVIAGSVWVANHHAGSISRIDPATDKVATTISVGPGGYGGPSVIVPVDGNLWVGFGNLPIVARVDTRTAKVTATVDLPDANTGPFVVDPQHVWAFYRGDAAEGIAMLDATGTEVASTLDLGGVPGSGAVFRDGVVWVPVLLHSAGTGGPLVAIDPATNAVADRISIADGAPSDVLLAFGSAWISLGLLGEIERFPAAILTVSY